MCNFHNAVALRAAADPQTGKVDPAYQVVIQLALSRYWAERYIEGGEKVNGYNPYPLATHDQQSAFERSGLKRPLAEVELDENRLIGLIRRKMSELATKHDLSVSGLGLPIATARAAYIDMAVMELYEGDPKGNFQVAKKPSRSDLTAVHRAVSYLHEDPEISMALEQLVKGKICTLYTEAPQKVRGWMIEGFENLPELARKTGERLSHYAGSIMLGGFSGLIGHSVHYASVLGAGLLAGTASYANLALSGVFLLASYAGWHQGFGGRYRSVREQAGAFGVQAGLTVAMAFGAQSLLGHDHYNSEKAQWFYSQPEGFQQSLIEGERARYLRIPEALRERLDLEAEGEGIPPELLLILCDGSLEVVNEINAFLQQDDTQIRKSREFSSFELRGLQ